MTENLLFYFIILISTLIFLQKWARKYLSEFSRSLKLMRMKFSEMDEYVDQDVLQYGVFGLKFALVNNPQMIQKVLTSDQCLEKPRLIYKLLGTKYSLVSEPYAQWRYDRRYFSSCFNNLMLQNLVPLFCGAAERMVKAITDKHGDSSVFNIHHYLEKCVVELVSAATFDVHLNELENGDELTNKIIETSNMSSTIFVNRMNSLPLLSDKIFHLTNDYKRDNDNRNFIFQSLLDFISTGNVNEPSDGIKQNIFLHKLLRIRNTLTDDQMKDHILAIGAAAFDALATSTAYCVLFLAMNEEIQEKVVKEIFELFSVTDELITLKKLAKLEYLGLVIKESLRLVPGVHGIGRQAMDEVQISPDCKLSKDTVILLNIFKLHRRKDLWGEDSECFNPERFRTENIGNRLQYYIPFSFGKRNCIGERYAISAFKIIIVKLLQSFEFTTELKLEDLRFDRQIAVKLENGHMVSVKTRR